MRVEKGNRTYLFFYKGQDFVDKINRKANKKILREADLKAIGGKQNRPKRIKS